MYEWINVSFINIVKNREMNNRYKKIFSYKPLKNDWYKVHINDIISITEK